MFLFSIALVFASIAQAISLWDPTGPYYVGYTQHIFNHTTPNDVTEPGTFMLATIYYPTLQVPKTTISYLDAISASLYEKTLGLTPGCLSQLTTRLQFEAPTLRGTSPCFANSTSPYPTLIFTAGAGLPASSYIAYVSELASYGYAVLTIDHPGEAPFLPLPYPDGPGGVYGYPNFTNFPPNDEDGQGVWNYRLSDLSAALGDSDSFFPALVRKTGAPFNLTHFGIFGHSIGGAAAATIMSTPANNTRLFKAGANLDGSFFEFIYDNGTVNTNATVHDLKLPFLEMASEAHFRGNDSAPDVDGTWPYFNGGQSGWLRDVQVNKTRHLDFSDIPLWIDLLDQREAVGPTWAGLIDGVRVTRLVSAMLREFFGSMKGEGLEAVDKLIHTEPEFFLLDEVRP